jgi:hypothetical protein
MNGRCSCIPRPGYDAEPGRGYPVVYVIQGYTGHVAMWRNRAAFRQPFPEAADAMFARGDAPPAIVVYVDAWTAYGGSQFVDSPGTGRYHSYLCDEVVAYVDARYRTVPDAAHRAVMGKSSGGFGAMITPMLRPDRFGALATHAGDSLYEYCYVPEFPAAVRHLRGYGGDIFRWWDDFRSRASFTKPEDMAFRAALLEAGVTEDLIRFELFDATHASIDYRYPLSLAWLCERITDLAPHRPGMSKCSATVPERGDGFPRRLQRLLSSG